MSPTIRNWLKRLLSYLAPHNSRRRRLVRRLRQMQTGFRARRILRLAGAHATGHATTLEAVNALLVASDLPPLVPAEHPASDSRADVVLWAVCRRLTGEDYPPFEVSPGNVVRQSYDEFTGWVANFPHALTPLGSCAFLLFLLRHAREIGREIGEILWFHLDNAWDPFQGVAAAWMRNPDWQKAVPDALTQAGWPGFIEWLDRDHAIEGGWAKLLPALPPDEPQPYRSGVDAPDAGVNLLGHFCYQCGLQEAARNTSDALRVAGVPHSCRDIPPGGIAISPTRPDRDLYLGSEYFNVSVFQVAPVPLTETAYALSGLARREDLPGGRPVHRVAMWYWELEQFPKEYLRLAPMFQEIWAPTEFIRKSIAAVMPLPVYRMPPSVRMPHGETLPRSFFGLDEGKHLFLFAFDMCSSMERKNPLATVEAFSRAFGKDRRVQLAIKVSRGEHDPENFARLREACDEAGAVLIDRVLTRSQMCGLMNLCDTYVSLHRSEGYGLTIAEAMLLGKSVIASEYSGNLDFTTPDNSLLVECGRVRLQKSIHVYDGEAIWGDPSVEVAAKAMRRLIDEPGLADHLARRAAIDSAKLLSPLAYGERLKARLAEIREAKVRMPTRLRNAG